MSIIICSNRTQQIVNAIQKKDDRMLSLLDEMEFLKEDITRIKKCNKRLYKKTDYLRATLCKNIPMDVEGEDLIDDDKKKRTMSKIDRFQRYIINNDIRVGILYKLLDRDEKEYNILLRKDILYSA